SNGSHVSPSMPASKPATPVATSAVSDRSADERIKISPLARSLAEAHNIDIHTIRGSGEGGRIVKRDVESHLGLTLSSSDRELQNDMGRSAVRGPQSPSRPDRGAAEQFDNWPELRPPQAQSHATQAPVPPVASPRVPQLQTSGQVHGSLVPSVQPQALSRMRETIASRMVESVNSIPHFYVTTKINADALVRMRQSLKSLQEYEGLTFNHLILKAVALALRAVPRVNASYRDGQLVQPQEINVGIVTALEDGLLIPIVKHADYLPLAELVREARGLVQRARAGKPKPDDLVGGTFSISNVGSFAVESFTAIISPGQGGILAVGAIDDEPVVRDGLLTVGKVFRATVSVDHRIIDGVVAATFLTELKRLAEDPVLLLA
ncbi:MAG: 2-oxo acid dehydrogenase subunit E2, partial [Bdellovibrionales bacterium]|nr:2-oxo acid dehydrogenase subunit E2 [Bdellovibrionales bacterium]